MDEPGRLRRKYNRVKVREYSDEELAGMTFVIGDPRSLSGLVDHVPPEDSELTFVGSYEVNDLIKCVFGHPHKKGMIFADEAGSQYPVGNECGSQLLGIADWETFRKGQENLRSRAAYLRQLAELKSVIGQNNQWLQDLPRHPAVEAMLTLRREIAKIRGLQTEAHKAVLNGSLNIRQRVRDIDAEVAREEREDIARERGGISSNRPPNHSPLYKEVEQSLGQLRGGPLFRPTGFDPGEHKTLVARLSSFASSGQLPQDRTQLVELSKNVRSQISAIITVRDDVAEAVAFFDPANIERFAIWANSRGVGQCEYRADHASLTIARSEHDRVIRLDRPPELVSMADEAFYSLESAAKAFDFRPQRRS